MTIKTRLRLNTVISLGVVILILFSLIWSFNDVSRASRNLALVDNMQQVSFERIIVRDDYLLYREARARTQWNVKSETLRRLLASASEIFTGSHDQALLKEAQRNFNATFTSFTMFMGRHKKEEGSSQMGINFNETDSRLIGQVFLRAYALRDSIDRLYASAKTAMTTAQNRGLLLILASIIGGVFAIVINSAFIGRIVAKRTSALAEGVGIMGTGNLDYRIDVRGDDELSSLARSSNEMAAKLQSSYAALEKESANLKSANEELEAFSYSVSHDLRTPLRAINGFSRAVTEDYADRLDDEGKRLLDVISHNAKKMGQLIDDLLAFSRIGRLELKKQETDMHALVNSVAQDLKQTASGRIIQIDIKPLPAAMGDPAMIRQIIVNLLSNAIKFSQPRDSIIIEIGSRPDELENVYYVKDHGVGFDMLYADKLFGVFQRLHGQEQFEGTGVGLALVQRIVHRHSGRLWAEGKVNEGATFYFTLPGMQEA
jgi:signal transduction histidine kinase